MDCRETRQLLSAYLDGQLEKDQYETVLAHLEMCEGCREELEELREAVSLVRRLPELSPPPEFRSQLRQRIAAGMENGPGVTGVSRFFTGRRRAQIIAVAAAICVVAGVTALWQGFSAPWDKKEMVQNIAEDNNAVEHPAGGEPNPAAGVAGDDRGQEVREKSVPGDAGIPAGTGVSEDTGISGDRDMPGSNDAGSPGGEQVDSSAQKEATGDGAVPESRAGPSSPPGAGEGEVTIMSVPQAEDGSAGPRYGSSDQEQEQELLMAPPGLGAAGAGEITVDKPGTIHITALTLGTGDLREAKDKIKQTAEKYNVMEVNEKENSVTLVCPERNYENILNEINKLGSVLNKQSWDREMNTTYNDICSQLTRLYAEEQRLTQKKELTSGDNELLNKTKAKIKDYEKQWQQIDNTIDKRVIEINLKPF